VPGPKVQAARWVPASPRIKSGVSRDDNLF